jgi:predicted membrane GTPase involved in stress response
VSTSNACGQVGTIIELLTARKAELLEVDQVDQGFGSAAAADTADSSSSSSGGVAGGSGSSSGSSGSNRQRLVFEVPARGMIGFKSLFASITRGEGLMQRSFAR